MIKIVIYFIPGKFHLCWYPEADQTSKAGKIPAEDGKVRRKADKSCCDYQQVSTGFPSTVLSYSAFSSPASSSSPTGWPACGLLSGSTRMVGLMLVILLHFFL